MIYYQRLESFFLHCGSRHRQGNLPAFPRYHVWASVTLKMMQASWKYMLKAEKYKIKGAKSEGQVSEGVIEVTHIISSRHAASLCQILSEKIKTFLRLGNCAFCACSSQVKVKEWARQRKQTFWAESSSSSSSLLTVLASVLRKTLSNSYSHRWGVSTPPRTPRPQKKMGSSDATQETGKAVGFNLSVQRLGHTPWLRKALRLYSPRRSGILHMPWINILLQARKPRKNGRIAFGLSYWTFW